ncbi:MAG: hypothetical protein ABSH47_13130 [Bryobacteraceae bacterium]|jgi:hypothetical protein
MRVLSLDRDAASDADLAAERLGVFTSGIVSMIGGGCRIGLYFTGRKHAGENLADVLRQRAVGLEAPIQMCDALSRNLPRLSEYPSKGQGTAVHCSNSNRASKPESSCSGGSSWSRPDQTV